MVSKGNCKYCKKYFKNGRARHEKTCKENPNREQEKSARTYRECSKCKKQILSTVWYKHHYCSICKCCFTVNLSKFNKHVAKHATQGLFFSAKLEKLFDDDRSNTGKKLVEQIKQHFKDRHDREFSYYYFYLILAIFTNGWLSFEEFCSAIVYVGKGSSNRIAAHNLGLTEINDDLRKFFEDCYAKDKQPAAFVSFTGLLDKEATAYEACAIRAIDPNNLTNKVFGLMPDGFDNWNSDDMAEAGTRILFDAYKAYLDMQFVEQKINTDKKILFDSPAKWFIKLKKNVLVEKATYTIKELKKQPNSDDRYAKIPPSISDDQLTKIFALMDAGDARQLALLNEDDTEPAKKRTRQE